VSPPPTVTATPTAKASHAEAAKPRAKAEHGATLARILVPTHVTGVARVVSANSSADTDLAAADVRRPAVVERVLHDRAPLVLGSLALLLLVAASGSFLLLAHRISRAGLPRES
jgi:hypothetical protein